MAKKNIFGRSPSTNTSAEVKDNSASLASAWRKPVAQNPNQDNATGIGDNLRDHIQQLTLKEGGNNNLEPLPIAEGQQEAPENIEKSENREPLPEMTSTMEDVQIEPLTLETEPTPVADISVPEPPASQDDNQVNELNTMPVEAPPIPELVTTRQDEITDEPPVVIQEISDGAMPMAVPVETIESGIELPVATPEEAPVVEQNEPPVTMPENLPTPQEPPIERQEEPIATPLGPELTQTEAPSAPEQPISEPTGPSPTLEPSAMPPAQDAAKSPSPQEAESFREITIIPDENGVPQVYNELSDKQPAQPPQPPPESKPETASPQEQFTGAGRQGTQQVAGASNSDIVKVLSQINISLDQYLNRIEQTLAGQTEYLNQISEQLASLDLGVEEMPGELTF